MKAKYRVGDRVCLVRYEQIIVNRTYTEESNRTVDRFKGEICTIDDITEFDEYTPTYLLHTDGNNRLLLSEEFLEPYDFDDAAGDLKSLLDTIW